jgi:multidrug efflux system outer membrane protein
MRWTDLWRAPRRRRRARTERPAPRRRQRGALQSILVLFALVLSGCPVGPNFVKPAPEMPPTYRSELEPVQAASFAAAPWWDVFHDDILRGLIDEAIANNYDLRTAVYRVEAAEHQVGITRAPLFPQAS